MGRTLLDVQRDLRIKAAYIAAIEDLDLAVFPNPSFIPGYVRAYARYLHLDPDTVFRRFCRESGFERPKDVSLQPKIGNRAPGPVIPGTPGAFRMRFPLATVARAPLVPLSAIGSVLVLAMLVGGLGYGGWMVLQNIQRVQFAPVDDLPIALAEMAPLAAPEEPEAAETVLTELAKPVAATALAELYRQQDVPVPILTPRDGPIAALDPDRTRPAGTSAALAVDKIAIPAAGTPDDPLAAILAAVEASLGAGETPGTGSGPTAVAAGDDPLVVVAERAAWIRVYLASGTIIFEQILERGESYSPPEGVADPMIWAGNSGAVYVRVGDSLRGPLGSGTRAVRDVVLTPVAITERYAEVDVVPEVISQAIGVTGAIGIQ